MSKKRAEIVRENWPFRRIVTGNDLTRLVFSCYQDIFVIELTSGRQTAAYEIIHYDVLLAIVDSIV